jgi:hypothetical protein
MLRSVFILACLLSAIPAVTGAQTQLHLLHPQPQQAYMRFFSAAFMPGPGHAIYLDAAAPAFREAASINAHLRVHGADTLELRIWTTADTMEAGIFLGVCSEFINGLLAAAPDQPLQTTPTYPGPEGYVLDALPSRILVNASDQTGLAYGVHTLRQLLYQTANWWGLEACRIIDAPEFPIRWVYHSSNLLVGDNVTQSKKLWDEALRHRINGVHFNDSKFSRPTTLPRRYLDSLAALRNYAIDRGLAIIPGVMPFGYSNSLLFHNPNLASGLPVREQRYVMEGDTARLLPIVEVGMPNGGFEQYSGHSVPGYRFIDQPGLISFVDTLVQRSGKASLRLENFALHSPVHGHGRISYWTKVRPFTLYHVRGWVRTENLQPASSINIAVLGNAGYNLAWNDFSVPSSTEWMPLDFTFNSLEADTVGVYWGVWGAHSGALWWDDLLIEETGLVNLLRRDGAPLLLRRIGDGQGLMEGRDVDSVRDLRMGHLAWPGDFGRWHTPPTIHRMPGGMLSNEDTISLSYYHAVLIYRGQVMCTMSHPEVYDILRREFALLDSVLASPAYFMQHDEIRTMNWDEGDSKRNLAPAEILADNVLQCRDIIAASNPDAGIWIWSDMFDEFHNAIEGPYYLVRGDLRGSAELLPRDIGIVNWNGREQYVQQSLKYFADRGFRQISAPYYDTDETQIRQWKEWTRQTPNFLGMMYTTWSKKYDHLEAFGHYAWNHAPHIYHLPPSELRAGENMYFPLRVEGDRWDADWEIEHVSIMYRTQPNLRFTVHEVNIQPGVDDVVVLALPPDVRWLQWYVAATDNRGWWKRVPFGDSVYYELGDLLTTIEEVSPFTSLYLGVAPNPASSGQPVLTQWSARAGQSATLRLRDILGREIQRYELGIADGRMQSSSIAVPPLPQGLYLLELRSGDALTVARLMLHASAGRR